MYWAGLGHCKKKYIEIISIIFIFTQEIKNILYIGLFLILLIEV